MYYFRSAILRHSIDITVQKKLKSNRWLKNAKIEIINLYSYSNSVTSIKGIHVLGIISIFNLKFISSQPNYLTINCLLSRNSIFLLLLSTIYTKKTFVKIRTDVFQVHYFDFKVALPVGFAFFGTIFLWNRLKMPSYNFYMLFY